jgi:hypothetical protein
MNWATKQNIVADISTEEAQRVYSAARKEGVPAIVKRSPKDERFVVVDRCWSMGKDADQISDILRTAATQAHLFDPKPFEGYP